LPEGQPDTDPAPSATPIGAFTASPKSVSLTEQDATFTVDLSATTSDPVKYRVQINAPHVSIDSPRGEFTSKTTLTFKVRTDHLKGRDVAGDVKIITSLGSQVVSCPIHVGLTGRYAGSIRYESDQLTLGDSRIALELLEKNGNVMVRVDSKRSLLFPATDAGETTGHGSFTLSDGLDVTLSQVIDTGFGGERNHFQRPLGRRVRLRLKPTSNGRLEGPVEETVYGLFTTPVTMRGAAFLEYQPQGTDPSFSLAEDPQMPAAPSKTAFASPQAVFGWTGRDCHRTLHELWPLLPETQRLEQLRQVEATYTAPLNASMIKKDPKSAQPFETIATACKASLGTKSKEDYKAPATDCGLIPPLACSLQVLTEWSNSDVDKGKMFGRVLAESIAPALLVAKNEIVSGLADSFAAGPSVERSRYDAALAALRPVATWVNQASILEYLRGMPPEAAKGDEPGGDLATAKDTYPAARALADLDATLSAVDGERARIGAAMSVGEQPRLAAEAQQRAVLTFLEASAVAEIARAWRGVPTSTTVKFAGVLGHIDQGFGALLDGANAFGFPPGFVPFVYRPEDAGKGPTNFEQMLAISNDALAIERSTEAQFVQSKRQYEANNQLLQQQLSAVRSTFDLQIKEICGPGLNPDEITRADDWNKCGQGRLGEIGVLLGEIDLAEERVRASQARIQGQKDKIQIDLNALAKSQGVHYETLGFISQTGQKVASLTLVEGVLSAIQESISVAANSNMMNFGAPGLMGPVTFAIGLAKASIETEKVNLQFAQTMRFEEAGRQIELINGMANIQRQTIDAVQLGIEIQQDVLAVLQARLKLINALQRAKNLHEERLRVLSVTSKDPANDPSYRLLRDQLAIHVLKARADAQARLYLAAAALQYELNMSVSAIEGAVLNAHNATTLEALSGCLLSVHNNARIAYGTPQEYVTTVSVRKLLGITGPRTDEVTDQTLSEGEQFRHLLLKNENLDGKGGVGITFATDLQPGNQLWSTDVCNDRISGVQAQIVGDFLGDNQAQLNISLSGASIMRACDADMLRPWSLTSGSATAAPVFAVVQAGVNTFGDAPPNTSLFGQSVARASWTIVIPGGKEAPPNADLDLTKIDDIVLRLPHKAVPRRGSPVGLDISCLSRGGR
jgi:hypothetical protein